jgi:translation initiation factor IF-2
MEARASGQESSRSKVTLENLFARLDSTQSKVLKVVVKADTQGSVEAIVDALKKIESDKVSLEIIHSAVGTITESDVALASASDAVILGFHTRIDSGVADKAKHEGVQIKLYAIIYELIDQVKEAMAGLLEPILKDVTVGVAEVRKIFELSKGAPVAGCMVTSGRIFKGKVRVRGAKRSSTRASCNRCADSRMKSMKSAPAWNAGPESMVSASTRWATILNVTPSRKSRRSCRARFLRVTFTH